MAFNSQTDTDTGNVKALVLKNIKFIYSLRFTFEIHNQYIKRMAYWLAKSEPSTYSWDQLVKDKQTVWDGVRNYAARLHLRAMKKGDEVLFYHSNEGTDIVGIAKVAKEAYQDPTTEEMIGQL